MTTTYHVLSNDCFRRSFHATFSDRDLTQQYVDANFAQWVNGWNVFTVDHSDSTRSPISYVTDDFIRKDADRDDPNRVD